MSLIPAHEWGLKSDNVPRFGARLVQEGNRLYYLADRAGFKGNFTPEQLQNLERSFPAITEKLENLLRIGELNPHQQRQVVVHLAEFTCIADTCGSCGYVYITIYP
ncbi:type IV toxin-antitoxin system YeeU family antitoxin [Citrobacter koseri]|uniref:type IV toxin-antitoxin system YeeU family antitoxin n=1 Tax=Citrobacter koseri TaxID=545 RepID=UPI002942D561|nr:type IV toxin-antitoxin system YeeU family antitoxin [Citrobacter koseri]WOJ30893.1 type IV toxin-antitoxin system YeeU family antitoxin [Citrobacter koseri]WOJ35067.1 type IV toxin-antitoxin system YeeU family antitoxin [Citrobacter koseri]